MRKNMDYYSVIPNSGVAELKVTKDSISVIWKKKEAQTQQSYEIADEEKRGKYIIAYVKAKAPSQIGHVAGSTSASRPYGIFVFYFADNKNRLHVLQESKLTYASLEEAKVAGSSTYLESKHFFTWYSDSLFTAAKSYPSLKDADKDTVVKVAGEFIAELNRNRDKIRNTQCFDIYGGGIGQNSLTKILIHNHLNPNISITDLDKKMEEYHIVFPQHLKHSNNSKATASAPGTKDSTTNLPVPKAVYTGKK